MKPEDYRREMLVRARETIERHCAGADDSARKRLLLAGVAGVAAGYLISQYSAKRGGLAGTSISGAPLEVVAGLAGGALAFTDIAKDHQETVLAVSVGLIASYTGRMGFATGLTEGSRLWRLGLGLVT